MRPGVLGASSRPAVAAGLRHSRAGRRAALPVLGFAMTAGPYSPARALCHRRCAGVAVAAGSRRCRTSAGERNALRTGTILHSSRGNTPPMPVLRSIEAKIESLFEGVSDARSGPTSSPSSSRGSSSRRWTTTRASPSRASTSPTSTRSTCRPTIGSNSRVRGVSRRRAPGVPRGARAQGALRGAHPTSRPRGDRRRPRDRRVRHRNAARCRRDAAEAPPPPELPVEAPAQTMIYRAAAGRSTTKPRRPEPVREVVSLTFEGSGRRRSRRLKSSSGARASGRPRLRRQRVPPPRRASPGRGDVLDRRPRVDQRQELNGKRIDRGRTARRRPHHPRLDGDRVRIDPALVMTTEIALSTDETLLILKIAFLVLLYGFILLVVRTATKGLDRRRRKASSSEPPRQTPPRAHGESTLVAPARDREPGATTGREIELTSPIVVGRDAGSGFASTATSSRPPATRASSPVPTASGSTISAPRTART